MSAEQCTDITGLIFICLDRIKSQYDIDQISMAVRYNQTLNDASQCQDTHLEDAIL